MKVSKTLALASLGYVQAQGTGEFLSFGFCPAAPELNPYGDKFEPEKYAGTWYEIVRDKDLWYEQDVECVTATYTYKKDEWLYPVLVNNQNYKRKEDKITNTLLFPDDKTSDATYARATFDEKGNGKVKFWWYPEGNYRVLYTDYTSMAVVYGCDDWFFFTTQQAWILSRTPYLSPEQIQMGKNIIDNKINKNGMQYDYEKQWVFTTQDNTCKYNI